MAGQGRGIRSCKRRAVTGCTEVASANVFNATQRNMLLNSKSLARPMVALSFHDTASFPCLARPQFVLLLSSDQIGSVTRSDNLDLEKILLLRNRCFVNAQPPTICYTQPKVQRPGVYCRIRNGTECVCEEKKLQVILWHASAIATDVGAASRSQTYVLDASAPASHRTDFRAKLTILLALLTWLLSTAGFWLHCAGTAFVCSGTIFDFFPM